MSWFRRAKPPSDTEAPPQQAGDAGADVQSRYPGMPLMYLLEDYVLDVIGALEPSKRRLLPSVVQRVYGGGEDWKATLRSVLKLGDGMDASIRAMWDRNQQIARENGVTLTPGEFAEMFVTRNFVPRTGDA